MLVSYSLFGKMFIPLMPYVFATLVISKVLDFLVELVFY